MPSTKKGETKDSYMHRCVPMLVKEGKKQDQAVAQCLNMFKEHWKAKGNVIPSDPKEFSELLASITWEDCPECVKMEEELNKKHGIFEIDMTAKARVSFKCDNCRETIDASKPKPIKGPDGKAKPARPNPAIKATLEASVDSDEVKDFHFCDSRCLYNFLKSRYSK